MNDLETATLVAFWVVCVGFGALAVRSYRISLREKDNTDNAIGFLVSAACCLWTLVLSILLSIPAVGLLSQLTTGIIWLCWLGSIPLFILAILLLKVACETMGGWPEALFIILFLVFGTIAIAGFVDFFLVGTARWLTSIGLRINDWQLMVSPIVWFIVSLALVISIIATEWPKNWSDGDLLFKLAALAGSLLCLVLMLDTDLHQPPITEPVFRPPLLWLTLFRQHPLPHFRLPALPTCQR